MGNIFLMDFQLAFVVIVFLFIKNISPAHKIFQNVQSLLDEEVDLVGGVS